MSFWFLLFGTCPPLSSTVPVASPKQQHDDGVLSTHYVQYLSILVPHFWGIFLVFVLGDRFFLDHSVSPAALLYVLLFDRESLIILFTNISSELNVMIIFNLY